jgi:hypothetical protein
MTRFKVKREAVVWGMTVWESMEMRLRRLEQQQPEMLIAQELHSQHGQHVHVFNSGDNDGCASQLWWQLQLELVGCRIQ